MKNKNIMVERYRLGELPRFQKNKLDRETLDGQVEEILKSDQEILEKYKPSLMAREIEEKRLALLQGKETNSVRIKRKAIPLYGMTAAAAVLILALILPGLMENQGNYDPQEITRIKGNSETVLYIYRKTGELTETLESGSSAKRGDLLQLSFMVSPDQNYAMIVSIDGRGIVTRHLAPQGEVTEKQTAHKEFVLPFSYELDDAPLFETFYLVVSDKPFPVDPVVDLLAREARGPDKVLDIPDIIRNSSLDTRGLGEITQYTISIKKEE